MIVMKGLRNDLLHATGVEKELALLPQQMRWEAARELARVECELVELGLHTLNPVVAALEALIP